MAQQTPKEKAEELINKYYTGREPNDNLPLTIYWSCAKQCALIAVDEIIANIEPSVSMDVIEARIKYWQEVKQEIEQL